MHGALHFSQSTGRGYLSFTASPPTEAAVHEAAPETWINYQPQSLIMSVAEAHHWSPNAVNM